jgi:hypothetical protein
MVPVTPLALAATAATGGEATSWTDWASVLIAVLALLVTLSLGLWNRKTAKRALGLSERQEARRESRVDLHLNESLAWRRDANEDRILGFHLVITNPTDRDTSIIRSELRINYSIEGVVATVKVPTTSMTGLSAPIPDVESVDVPARLNANDTISGWFLFQVPDQLIHNRPVDRYEVVFRDLHEIEESVQVTVFHEVPL